MRLFLTQHLGWYDENGKQLVAASMNDVNLPLALVAKARALGAAWDLDSPQRKQHGGSKTSAPPAWSHCKILNDNPTAKTASAPIMSSHFTPLDRGGPVTGFMRTAPAGPETASRTMTPGGGE
jgi:hypothetical protein